MTKDCSFIWNYSDNYQPLKMIGLAEDIKNQGAYIAYNETSYSVTEEIKKTFGKYTTKDNRTYYIYGYGNLDLEGALDNLTNRKNQITNKSEIQIQPNPTKITIEKLINIFNRKDFKQEEVTIYTGAGISLEAGLPDMNEIIEYLEIKDIGIDKFTKNVIEDSNILKEKISNLSKKFTEATTPAHKYLKQLQDKYKIKIVTENVDSLHENIETDVINRSEIEKKITNEVLKNTKYLIIIGLARDDSNLIKRYKELNQTGTILAVNINIPSYLRNSDWYIEGDAQKILKDIIKNL